MKGKLTLERQENESITINLDGREVVVSVAKIKGSAVRLTVEADTDVKILRSELTDQSDL